MQALGINRLLHTASLVMLSALTVAAGSGVSPLTAQELPTGPNQARPIDPNDPNVIRPGMSPETGILSMQAGQRLFQEATGAVTGQDYTTAVKKFQEARQIFNQLSNFYQDLAGVFSGIENRIADSNRRKALETAQMRDDATYQLALVHRAQNQPELAVPLLIQIIRSQQPTRDLGKKAYQQLAELGFAIATEDPSATPDPSAPNAPNIVRPTNPETGILSMAAGQRLIQEANSAVTAQNYALATKKFQEARQVFNQLSNFYQELAGVFAGIESRVAASNRQQALETAQLRDDATYQLALVHRARNQPELAVPLLIQIVRSQQPTRDLGKKAYQQLFELGFVDSPFPRNQAIR